MEQKINITKHVNAKAARDILMHIEKNHPEFHEFWRSIADHGTFLVVGGTVRAYLIIHENRDEAIKSAVAKADLPPKDLDLAYDGPIEVLKPYLRTLGNGYHRLVLPKLSTDGQQEYLEYDLCILSNSSNEKASLVNKWGTEAIQRISTLHAGAYNLKTRKFLLPSHAVLHIIQRVLVPVTQSPYDAMLNDIWQPLRVLDVIARYRRNHSQFIMLHENFSAALLLFKSVIATQLVVEKNKDNKFTVKLWYYVAKRFVLSSYDYPSSFFNLLYEAGFLENLFVDANNKACMQAIKQDLVAFSHAIRKYQLDEKYSENILYLAFNILILSRAFIRVLNQHQNISDQTFKTIAVTLIAEQDAKMAVFKHLQPKLVAFWLGSYKREIPAREQNDPMIDQAEMLLKEVFGGMPLPFPGVKVIPSTSSTSSAVLTTLQSLGRTKNKPPSALRLLKINWQLRRSLKQQQEGNYAQRPPRPVIIEPSARVDKQPPDTVCLPAMPGALIVNSVPRMQKCIVRKKPVAKSLGKITPKQASDPLLIHLRDELLDIHSWLFLPAIIDNHPRSWYRKSNIHIRFIHVICAAIFAHFYCYFAKNAEKNYYLHAAVLSAVVIAIIDNIGSMKLPTHGNSKPKKKLKGKSPKTVEIVKVCRQRM